MSEKQTPQQLTIGTRDLALITKDEVLQVAVIEGCCPHLEYWNIPQITYFDNTMFSHTVVLDYHSTRKDDDGHKSPTIVFFFDHKNLNFHYHNRNRDSHSKRFSFETIRYLLKQDFYLPLID